MCYVCRPLVAVCLMGRSGRPVETARGTQWGGLLGRRWGCHQCIGVGGLSVVLVGTDGRKGFTAQHTNHMWPATAWPSDSDTMLGIERHKRRWVCLRCNYVFAVYQEPYRHILLSANLLSDSHHQRFTTHSPPPRSHRKPACPAQASNMLPTCYPPCPSSAALETSIGNVQAHMQPSVMRHRSSPKH